MIILEPGTIVIDSAGGIDLMAFKMSKEEELNIWVERKENNSFEIINVRIKMALLYGREAVAGKSVLFPEGGSFFN